MDEGHQRFSDFTEEEVPLEGKKRKIEEILNIEILITGFRIGKSKYKDKDYLTLQYENGKEKYITFTGSEVLIKQTQKYAEKMPFYVTIRKVNNYYTMT
ncbi:MAG: hypothetical protein H8D26_09405 [Methanomicrobia archaeon]|nr:hypothetical protein [Methanomicrobia archaeon]